MVHSLMSDKNVQRHVERMLSPTELKIHLARARVERSKVFGSLLGSVHLGVRKFVSRIGY